MTVYTPGVVVTAAWTKNSVASTGVDEVVLINNAGSDTASVLQASTVSVAALVGAITAQCYISTGADDFQIGVLPSTVSDTTITGSGIENQTGFYGIAVDVYNGQVRAYYNGSNTSSTAVSGLGTNAYNSYAVAYTVAASVLTMKLYRDSILLATFTGAAPSYTAIRMAFGARSGGVSGTFKVKGSPSFQDDLTPSAMSFTTYPWAAGIGLTWAAPPFADSYDYRINGGSITNTTALSAKVVGLTGLSTNTVEVRAVSATSGPGPWTLVSVTLPSNGWYDDFEQGAVAPSSSALAQLVSGQSWVQPSGAIGRTNGQAYITSTAAENYGVVDLGTTEQDVSLVLPLVSSPDPGLLFRYRDTSNYFMWQLLNSTTHALYRRQAGSLTQLASVSVAATATETIRIQAIGDSVRLYINGRLWLAYEDMFYLSTDTYAGIREQSTTSRIETFYARPIDLVADTKTAWVNKGRASKTLDTVGAA